MLWAHILYYEQVNIGYYLYSIFGFATTVAFPEAARWIYFLAPFWIPAMLIPIAWELWVEYVHYKWQTTRKYAVLEIKLPQEIAKSPAAMELVLHGFIQTGGEGTPHERYWKGKARPWASLEIAVIKGEVRFFIWCHDGQKTVIMGSIYAQYPDVAIHEVEDYTKSVSEHMDKWDIWACQYDLTKPTCYPIKTYIDYGLSDDPDEEFKVDPLANLLELLGTTTPEDQIWMQFIIRAHKKESNVFNHSGPDLWMDAAKKEIQKILDSASVPRIEADGSVTLVPTQGKMTTEKKDLIDAISRSISKNPFDVGIRCIQVYPKGAQGHIRADIIKGAFRQFGSNILNNIKPDDINYNYYWQDPFKYFNLPWGPRDKWLGTHLFKSYCERSFFWYPYRHAVHVPFILPWSIKNKAKPIMILNTEELATLYHFPGSAVKAPALKRIPSKRSDAPSNLPI